MRNALKIEHEVSLLELYQLMELPGNSPLKDAHATLNEAVREAYGMGKSDKVLNFLLELNKHVVEKERSREEVQPPGLPYARHEQSQFVTKDCISMP